MDDGSQIPDFYLTVDSIYEDTWVSYITCD